MGHVRLGRLPTSRKWQEVVGYLSAEAFSVVNSPAFCRHLLG